MRPTGLVTAAFAAGQLAEVYLFTSESLSDPPPQITTVTARQILLQRLSRDQYGSPLRTVAGTTDDDATADDATIGYINTFGRSRPSIFGTAENKAEPAQLVVVLEGVTAENVDPWKQSLSKSDKQQPAFLVPDPPSMVANDRLLDELRAHGAVTKPTCEIEAAINPYDKSCWDGLSTVVRYDMQKTPEVLSTLTSNLGRLSKFVSSGELEALLVLLPESSRSSKLTTWDASRAAPSRASDLRRRDSELVISDEPAFPLETSTNSANDAFWADNLAKAQTRVPACFPSLNSCVNKTNNCSGGHGVCIDRYQNDAKAKQSCFACHCMSTVVLNGTEKGATGEKTVRWAGNMCQKKDISVPFWLLTGFTITIVGAVTFAIGLLYSVGEEKLPGVIGAGVSRSK